MASMLQQFIYRGTKYSKQKAKNQDLNFTVQQDDRPLSPESFMSPEIVNINEVSFVPVGRSQTSSLYEEESYGSYDSRLEEPRSNQMSPQLEVDIPTEPLTDWFTHDTLRMAGAFAESFQMSNGSGSISGSVYGVESSSSAGAPSSEDLRKAYFGSPSRKPASLRIPHNPAQGPKPRTRRSDNANSTTTTHPHNRSHPRSPCSSDDISSVSGATLARALIGNSFVLSSDVISRHRSGASRGRERLDSATLPRGEHPFLNTSFWRDKRISGGDIILTPGASEMVPVPSLPSNSSLLSKDLESGTSLDSLHAKKRHKPSDGGSRAAGIRSSPGMLLPLIRPSTSTGIPVSERSTSRREFQIMEMSLPAPSAPSKSDVTTINLLQGASISKAAESPEMQDFSRQDSPPSDYDIPKQAPPPHPRKQFHNRRSYSDTSLSPRSTHAISITNVLDDYLLTPAGESSRSAISPMASDSPASMPAPHRTSRQRFSKQSTSAVYSTNSSSVAASKARVDWVQRTRPSVIRGSSHDNPKVKLLPIGERGSVLVPHSLFSPGSPLRSSSNARGPFSPLTTPRSVDTLDPVESSDILDGKLAPISHRGVFARQRSGSTPSPIAVIHESRDICHFDITVGTDGNSSQVESPSARSDDQTFPETPHAFSPLWTASSIDGAHAAIPMPSISITSSLTHQPNPSPRSASLSSGHQPTLAQKVLLSRTTTRSGDRPTAGNAKLTTVTEVKELVGSLPPSPPPSQPSHLSSLSETSPMPPQARIDPPEFELSSPQPPPYTNPPVLQALSSQSSAESSPKSLPDVAHAPDRHMSPPLVPPVVPSRAAMTPSPPVPSSHPSASATPYRRPSPSSQPSIFNNTQALPAPTFPMTTSPPSRQAPSYPALRQPTSRRPPESESPVSFPPTGIKPPSYHAITADANSPLPRAVITRQGSDPIIQAEIHSHLSTSSQSPSQNRPSVSGRAAGSRPPLPIGPRKPSSSHPLTPVSLGDHSRSVSLDVVRDRNGFVSSLGGSAKNGGTIGGINSANWRKVLSRAPTPKFSTPVPKHRGYTMEAATWTFTSQQLQDIVSRAIKQSAEASSVRLLQLETLDVDIPTELHHLEMQKMDIKMKYKSSTRTRWVLLGSLAAHMDGAADSATALRILGELTEISTTLDKLADELHSVTQQLAQLKSLTDVHSASALAMALRKLNTSLLKQMAENQQLKEQISALEDERDEAWKQAEDVAHEYDDLHDRYGGDDYQILGPSKFPSSRRSSRVMAVRKSSIIVSRAGLRSSSLRRSQRSSIGSNGHRGSMQSALVGGIPPVPRMPQASNVGIATVEFPSCSSLDLSPAESRSMIKVQEELYEMLGISIVDSTEPRTRTRSRSVTGPLRHSRQISLGSKSPYARPVSEISLPTFRTSSIPSAQRNFFDISNGSDTMLTFEH